MKRLFFVVPLAVTALAGCATEPRQHPYFMTAEQDEADHARRISETLKNKPELSAEEQLKLTDDELGQYLGWPDSPQRESLLQGHRSGLRRQILAGPWEPPYVPDLRGRGVPGSADGISPGGVSPYPCSSPRPGERIVGYTQASNGVASVALCGS